MCVDVGACTCRFVMVFFYFDAILKDVALLMIGVQFMIQSAISFGTTNSTQCRRYTIFMRPSFVDL